MDPSAWMERLQQGDREALEPLLAHYEGMLRYIVSGVLSDPHRQEDCLAEVRLKLWEKREQYDPERSSPATWLTVLCRNAAVDHLRSAQRHSAEALDEAVRPRPGSGGAAAAEGAGGASGACPGLPVQPGPRPVLPQILLSPVHRPHRGGAGAHPCGRWRAACTASERDSRTSWEVIFCEAGRI